MLCYVASGQADSYWERQIALWDVGAALAIVQAAGGCARIGEVGETWRLDVEAAGREELLMSEVIRR
jgi:fructose-1,6-bisphosphatase/inositol monophosphatase family enzyme